MKTEICKLLTFNNDWIYFKAESDKPVKIEDALASQIRMGYPPAGYGFFVFESDVRSDGIFTATWKCHTSCE